MQYIFHTLETISIDRFSRMQYNHRLSSRIPFIWTKKSYQNLINDFNQQFSGSVVFQNEILKTHIYNKITMLKSMADLILFKKYDMAKEFEEYFGIPFLFKEGLKLLTNEINKLITKYKAMIVNSEKQEESPKLEKIVMSVEIILNRSIDRRIKMYEFKQYYELAKQHANNK